MKSSVAVASCTLPSFSVPAVQGRPDQSREDENRPKSSENLILNASTSLRDSRDYNDGNANVISCQLFAYAKREGAFTVPPQSYLENMNQAYTAAKNNGASEEELQIIDEQWWIAQCDGDNLVYQTEHFRSMDTLIFKTVGSYIKCSNNLESCDHGMNVEPEVILSGHDGVYRKVKVRKWFNEETTTTFTNMIATIAPEQRFKPSFEVTFPIERCSL